MTSGAILRSVRVALVLLLAGCAREPEPGHRLLVLGFDGLDPVLLDRFMAAGELPHFSRLASMGNYRRLGTTVPPQSPVAWSTFITGLDPGGHGIFDFIHRDPRPEGGLAVSPFLSTSRSEEDEWSVSWGSWKMPLRAGKTELLRHGKAFWNVLEEHGVPATVVKIPANFPPEPSHARTLSDMGTPDLRGTPRTFFFYTDDPKDGASRSVSGGVIRTVDVIDGRVRAKLPGPPNPFRKKLEYAERPFEVFVDARSDAAAIEIDGQRLVLERGEWSPWVPVTFELMPWIASVRGIVRFHLASVEPFRLYASPVNVDPEAPALPISTPPDYSRDLFQHIGRYYTQGLAEDTNALTANMLDDHEFREQARDVYEERMRILELELGRFRSGLLFAYFGGVDQTSHMFWRTLDPAAGGLAPSAGAPNGDAILSAYRELDGALGRAIDALGGMGPSRDPTIVVMSDHGFAPFARAAHLNSFLAAEKLLALKPGKTKSGEIFRDVDWSRTRAYGFGLNGLYVNLSGRERLGIVSPAERDALLGDLQRRLLAWRDPDNGAAVVSRAYRREEVYHGPETDSAPDLIVGYKRGYRVSNESALGEVGAKLVETNEKKWSGDHCMAAEEVPGVLLSNRPITREAVSLLDLAPTILGEFGIDAPAEMRGQPFLGK